MKDGGLAIASCYITNCDPLLKNIGILFGMDTISCYEFEGIIDDIIDFFNFILDKLGIFGDIIEELLHVLDFIFTFILDFKSLFDNLIQTLKELTGIDLEASIIKQIIEVSKSFIDFLQLLFEYVLDVAESLLPDTVVNLVF